MTLSASMRVEQRPLRLIYVFSLALVRREVASGPLRASLRTSVSRSRIGWLEPPSPLGSDRGRSCFTRHPVLGFHNRRGRANDTCLDGSSVVLNELANGMFMWNLGPSFADGVDRALMWHSTTS